MHFLHILSLVYGVIFEHKYNPCFAIMFAFYKMRQIDENNYESLYTT